MSSTTRLPDTDTQSVNNNNSGDNNATLFITIGVFVFILIVIAILVRRRFTKMKKGISEGIVNPGFNPSSPPPLGFSSYHHGHPDSASDGGQPVYAVIDSRAALDKSEFELGPSLGPVDHPEYDIVPDEEATVYKLQNPHGSGDDGVPQPVIDNFTSPTSPSPSCVSIYSVTPPACLGASTTPVSPASVYGNDEVIRTSLSSVPSTPVYINSYVTPHGTPVYENWPVPGTPSSDTYINLTGGTGEQGAVYANV